MASDESTGRKQRRNAYWLSPRLKDSQSEDQEKVQESLLYSHVLLLSEWLSQNLRLRKAFVFGYWILFPCWWVFWKKFAGGWWWIFKPEEGPCAVIKTRRSQNWFYMHKAAAIKTFTVSRKQACYVWLELSAQTNKTIRVASIRFSNCVIDIFTTRNTSLNWFTAKFPLFFTVLFENKEGTLTATHSLVVAAARLIDIMKTNSLISAAVAVKWSQYDLHFLQL